MMERPLGLLEKIILRLDRGSPLNFTTVARVKGPLTGDRVRAGLGAVRERHPYLRACISVDETGAPSFRGGGAPPSLREVAGGDWIAEAEREVNEPVSVETGPLVRCVLVQHAAEDHSLLLTFHHSIGDGMSGVYLMRDLLTAVATGGSAPTLAPLSDTLAVDSRFPAVERGLPGWLRWMRLFLREAWVHLRYGKPLKVRRDREAFAYERQARLIHQVLDEAFVTRLTERAREEGTTVHGALSAAMLLAVLSDAEAKGPKRVAFGSPVNLRKELVPAVGEDVGFYVAMLAFSGPVSAADGFWDVARAIRVQTSADLSRGVAFTALRLMTSVFSLLGGHTLEPRQFCERWEGAVPTTTGLTNLGRLSIETRFGALSIESLHFLAAPSSLGDFIATATSLHGQLFWNFVWTDPVFEASHARALVGDIVTRVRQAVDGVNG